MVTAVAERTRVAAGSRAAAKTVLDCSPELKARFHFLGLFGLAADPALYKRMIESDGMSVRNLRQFQAATGLSIENVMALLGVAPRTMDRRLEAGRLHPDEADKLFQVARAFDLVLDIFENPEDTLTWFRTPHLLLDKETPLESCITESGRNSVIVQALRLHGGGY